MELCSLHNPLNSYSGTAVEVVNDMSHCAGHNLPQLFPLLGANDVEACRPNSRANKNSLLPTQSGVTQQALQSQLREAFAQVDTMQPCQKRPVTTSSEL